MSRLEELPPDQRAALSIVLRQGKSYAEVAGMLSISERAVQDRAHAALAVLAPLQARALDPAVREEVGDYVLGQQASIAARMRTRTLLATSASAGEWARALAAELNGAGTLPELPPPPPSTAAPQPPPGEPAAPYSLAEAAASPSLWEPPAAPSSRRGGAILLAALLVGGIIVIVLVLAGNGSSKKASTTASTGTSASAKSTEPQVKARFTLKPTAAGSKSTGAVEILSAGGKRAFYIQASHIPASKGFFYAVWLYNSPTSALPLSKSEPVGATHKLAGAALLPENAGAYKEILLTRETSTKPAHPGHIVLRGPFKVSG